MHILLIDESKRGRQIVCRFLTRAVPDAQVHEFHPLESGKPDRDFEWSAFDVVILGQNMSGDESGLDWFRGWATLEEYPPTILLTAKDESKIVAEAARLGAQAVICKRDLTPALLAEAVHAASERRVKPPGRPAKRSDLDAEIVSQSTDGDGYDLGRLIGHGGMSRVYLAKRRDNGAIVVLKVMEGMMEADNDPVRRFALEAELASKTESRHVVRIFDRGFTDHFGFIAMEYLVGGDLKERISQGLKAHDALSYALQIAHGLEAIHSVGIVHRDLKPANIMFRADDTVVVADFGISKTIDATLDLTQAGTVMGTPSYMSPEQTQALHVDIRSDLYSLGIILFEMLAGAKPFNGTTAASVAYAHVFGEIPSLPPHLSRYEAVLKRLMAKQPEDRHQSAKALIAELTPLCSAPVSL